MKAFLNKRQFWLFCLRDTLHACPSGRRASRFTRNGFTLPEMTLSLMGFSVLILVTVSLFIVVLKETQSTLLRNDLRQDAVLAIERLSRDINEAREITSAQARSITFWWQDTDGDGVRDANELITFSWDGTTGNPLQRGSVNIVMNVNNFQLSYRNLNNTTLTPAPDLTLVERDSLRRIDVLLTLSNTNETVNVVTSINPRNLRQNRGPW